MTRKFFFFSEMGYNAYPLEALQQYGYSALLFPNSIFDPEKARDLWQMGPCRRDGHQARVRRDLRLFPGVGIDGTAARLPLARAILGVHALLGERVDARGDRSRRAAPRNDLPDRVETLHAQPHLASSAAWRQYADIAVVGRRGRDHANQ